MPFVICGPRKDDHMQHTSRIGRRALCSAVLAATLMSAAATRVFAQDADLAFVNGSVFTAAADNRPAQAFAVKDGHFLAVGSSDAVRQHIGPRTAVIDLQGRFVTPGLSDGHLHNEGGGPGVDLSAART